MDSYKTFIFNIVLTFRIFYGFILKILNIISFDQLKKYEHASHEKMPKLEQEDQIKLLDGCCTAVEFFFFYNTFIFLFW